MDRMCVEIKRVTRYSSFWLKVNYFFGIIFCQSGGMLSFPSLFSLYFSLSLSLCVCLLVLQLFCYTGPIHTHILSILCQSLLSSLCFTFSISSQLLLLSHTITFTHEPKLFLTLLFKDASTYNCVCNVWRSGGSWKSSERRCKPKCNQGYSGCCSVCVCVCVCLCVCVCVWTLSYVFK